MLKVYTVDGEGVCTLDQLLNANPDSFDEAELLRLRELQVGDSLTFDFGAHGIFVIAAIELGSA
jgi:hypothetical protein